MKIVSVSHYYTPHLGGLEVVAAKQAQSLVRLGHTVSVVTSASAEIAAGSTSEDGVQVFRERTLNFFDERFDIPFPILLPRMAKRLRDEIQHTDIVHIHDIFYMTSWCAYLFARWYKKPLFLTQHVAIVAHNKSVVMAIQRMVYALMGDRIFRYARKIITYNENVKGFLIERGVSRERILMRRNGIDLLPYANQSFDKTMLRKKYGLPTDRVIALFVGRLVPKKGFDILAEARNPLYDIVIAGPGEVPARFLGVPGLHFLGGVPHETLPELYALADIFVFPAVGEIYTLVMQEAMASGLPVITTDDIGYKNSDFDRSLIVLTKPDTPHLSTQLTRLAENAGLRVQMGTYARTYAQQHFDWEKNFGEIARLYEEVVEAKQYRTKLLITVPHFPPAIGGVEHYTEQLAEILAEDANFSVVVITTSVNKWHSSKELHHGVLVYRLPYLFRVFNTPIGLLWYFRIKHIISIEKPDIINAHAPVPYMAEITALASSDTPLVLTYHSGSMKKGTFIADIIIGAYERLILPLLFHASTRIVAVSQSVRGGLLLPWETKVCTISPAINLERFTFAPLPPKQNRITYVGRIEHSSYWKGISVLLYALREVILVRPDVSLELIGSGDAIDAHKRLAEELGISGNVIFTGVLHDDALIAGYERSALVILPSLSDAESFGMTLIEGMAIGRPVIGSRVGGIPTVIDDNVTGLLVPPGDAKALGQAILRVLSDVNLAKRLADAGREKVARLYGHVAQGVAYKNLFSHIITLPTMRTEAVWRTSTLIFYATLWWGVFTLLSFAQSNPLSLLNVIGFSYLVFVPGTLAYLLLRLPRLPAWATIPMVVTLSMLLIMLVVLIGNSILPHLGVSAPLERNALLFQIGILHALLAGWLLGRGAHTYVTMSVRSGLWILLKTILRVRIPILLLSMAILGAQELNTNGEGFVTFGMLSLLLLYLWQLHKYSDEERPGVIATALYFIALALLLMTSLRGEGIIGHDIVREFLVFKLAVNEGVWNIDFFQDAYNACLSITTLPATLFGLLEISDTSVFKVLYQMLFATIAPLIYTTLRNFFPRSLALLSTLFFITFPTFFTDMPMLNRQEVAFLFLAMMVYVMQNTSISAPLRRMLFVFFGIGMILSHYSTTYTTIALFVFIWISTHLISRLQLSPPMTKLFPGLFVSEEPGKRTITFSVLFILIVCTLFWTSIVTHTAEGSIGRVVNRTVSALFSNAASDGRSEDTLFSIFSWKSLNEEEVLREYEIEVIKPLRDLGAGKYYDATTLPGEVTPVTRDVLPQTSAGVLIRDAGLEPTSLIYALRQGFAKFFQLLIVVGLVGAVFLYRTPRYSMRKEFILMAIGCVGMVASLILLPILSAEYGVLRAYQQSLMVLAPLILIGMSLLLRGVGESSRKRIMFTVFGLYFVTITGMLTIILGGYEPPLHLRNAGLYYDRYYLHDEDIAAKDWLTVTEGAQNGAYQVGISDDRLAVQKAGSISYVHARDYFYPLLLRTDSFVLLNRAVIESGTAGISHNGTFVTYTYPISFLDTHKNLVYDNGGARIYR